MGVGGAAGTQGGAAGCVAGAEGQVDSKACAVSRVAESARLTTRSTLCFLINTATPATAAQLLPRRPGTHQCRLPRLQRGPPAALVPLRLQWGALEARRPPARLVLRRLHGG